MGLSSTYWIALFIYLAVMAVWLYYYVTKPKPQGPDSVPWAIGLFNLLFLGVIVVVSYLFVLFQWYRTAVVILGIPLAYFLFSPFKHLVTDLYVWLPLGRVKPLTLVVINNRMKMVHVKIECMLGTYQKGTFYVYRTFNYHLLPRERRSFELSAQQASLLAKKSKHAYVYVYEQEIREYEGTQYTHEIQPCFLHFKEQPVAFSSGVYTIEIPAS